MRERVRANERESPARGEETCAACGKRVPGADVKTCPMCGRRVCVACLRPYGHHMRVCDDCRLAEW
jgi:hypothetical protein